MGTFAATGRSEFERVAAVLAERAAELLRAAVVIRDEAGAVVARGEPETGYAPRPPGGADPPPLHLPLELDGRRGEVIVSDPAGDEAIPPRLAEALIELMVGQVAVVDRLPNQHQLKNKLISDLLRGAIGDEAAVVRDAKLLGMDLSTPRAVVIIDARDYILGSARREEAFEAEVRRRSELVIGSIVSFFHLPDDTICAYIGDGEVVVLKASNTRNLASWLDGGEVADQDTPSWTNLTALKRAAQALLSRLRADTRATINVGIGRYHPGVRGLARSYEDALAALSLGRRFQGPNKVHCLDALGVAAFVGVADEQTKVELATFLLSPLDHEPELLGTLQAFFEADCCPSASASRLAIHRNTLTYRFDKIASLTGLDPRKFDEAVQIRLALVLRSLRAEAA